MGRYESQAAELQPCQLPSVSVARLQRSSLARECHRVSTTKQLWQALPARARTGRLRLRTRFLLAGVVAGERVLDVGCGEGPFASELMRAGAHVVGVDVAEEPLRRARSRDRALDVRLIALGGAWELADASFDVVWAGEVIEHVADTAAWLSEVRRVLRSARSAAAQHARHTGRSRSRTRAVQARVRAPLRPARRSPALLHAAPRSRPARGLRLRAGQRAGRRRCPRRAARCCSLARRGRASDAAPPSRAAPRCSRCGFRSLRCCALGERFRRDRLRVQVDRRLQLFERCRGVARAGRSGRARAMSAGSTAVGAPLARASRAPASDDRSTCWTFAEREQRFDRQRVARDRRVRRRAARHAGCLASSASACWRARLPSAAAATATTPPAAHPRSPSRRSPCAPGRGDA